MHLQYSVYVLLGLLGCCIGDPIDDSKHARILKYDYDDSGKGSYRFGYETSDGITREERSEVHYPNTKHQFLKVTGLFSYPGPDGVMYEVRYTADDQGFHPEGDHIKVPPFVPWVHHPHDDEDNNDISDSGTGEQRLDIVNTTPRPSTEYLPSVTPSSTTYLPPSSTTPRSDYNSGENILGALRPELKHLSNSQPLEIRSNFITSTPSPSIVLNEIKSEPDNTKSIPDANTASNQQLFTQALLENKPKSSNPGPQLVPGGTSSILPPGNTLEGIKSIPSTTPDPILLGAAALERIKSSSLSNSSPQLLQGLKSANLIPNGNNLDGLKVIPSSAANPILTGVSILEGFKSSSLSSLSSSSPNAPLLSEKPILQMVNPELLRMKDILEGIKSVPLLNIAPNHLLSNAGILEGIKSSSLTNPGLNPGDILETVAVIDMDNHQLLPLDTLKEIMKPILNISPNPQVLTRGNILEQLTSSNVPNAMCLQALPCNVPQQNIESTGSSPGPSIVYLPSTSSPPQVDDSRNENVLSTPKPHPELYFHSTAESQTQLRFATPAPPMMMMMRNAKNVPVKMDPIVAAKK